MTRMEKFDSAREELKLKNPCLDKFPMELALSHLRDGPLTWSCISLESDMRQEDTHINVGGLWREMRSFHSILNQVQTSVGGSANGCGSFSLATRPPNQGEKGQP